MTARKGSRTAPRKIGSMEKGIREPGRTALLTCRHLQEFRPPPVIGDTVYCHRCRDYRDVVVLQSDYAVRCRGCKYGRKFGRAMWAADQSARKHGELRGHVVDRYDGTTLEWTYTPGGDGEQLALGMANGVGSKDDPPPF